MLVMNPFMVFAYDQYYPSGGTSDFIGSFATVAEAKEHMATAERRYDQVEIVTYDGEKFQLVEVIDW
jgi:hypothetical protein